MWTRTARAPRLPERDAAHDSETQGDGAFGADIKSRIRELTGEIGGTHAGPAHRHSACAVRPDGAAQIRLTGPPTAYPHMPDWRLRSPVRELEGVTMSKSMDRKKEPRKKAGKTFDEKRAAKREKRANRR